MGFVLCFGSLMAKLRRVVRIFNSSKLTAVYITDLDLAWFIFVVALPDLVLLIAWSIGDTPKWTYEVLRSSFV